MPPSCQSSIETWFATRQGESEGAGLVRACFTGETFVHCEAGLKCIDEIEVSERVWSFDENHGSIALCEVLELYCSAVDPLIELVAGNTTARLERDIGDLTQALNRLPR